VGTLNYDGIFQSTSFQRHIEGVEVKFMNCLNLSNRRTRLSHSDRFTPAKLDKLAATMNVSAVRDHTCIDSADEKSCAAGTESSHCL